MYQSPLSTKSGPHDTDDTEEAVLVEVQEFSEDDENFVPDEDSYSDFAYEDEEPEEEDDFEDDEEEMSIARVRLHDLNTLSHLYRFGLLSTQAGPYDKKKYPPSNKLNSKITIWYVYSLTQPWIEITRQERRYYAVIYWCHRQRSK